MVLFKLNLKIYAQLHHCILPTLLISEYLSKLFMWMRTCKSNAAASAMLCTRKWLISNYSTFLVSSFNRTYSSCAILIYMTFQTWIYSNMLFWKYSLNLIILQGPFTYSDVHSLPEVTHALGFYLCISCIMTSMILI
jgi:hypothetical protein